MIIIEPKVSKLLTKILLILLFTSGRLMAEELPNSLPQAGLTYMDVKGVSQPVVLLNTSVEMHVHGLVNRVKVTQHFKNDSENWINANYLFPLPDNAAVDLLKMVIGDRVINGEIQEKIKAKKTFEAAKNEGKNASLVKHLRSNIFNTAVANIAPKQAVSIEIQYQQIIDFNSGAFSFYFPMAITPRYAPSQENLTPSERNDLVKCLDENMQQNETTNNCESNWQTWLQQRDSSALAQQTTQSIKRQGDANVKVDLNIYMHSLPAIKNINSPYHGIKIQQQDGATTHISLSDEQVVADRDFMLTWQVPQGESAQGLLFVENKDNQKYGTLMLLPPGEQFSEKARIDKQVTFVIDISGSMSGRSIQQAKAALNFALEQLDENDTFNIISFNDHSRFFSSNALPVDNRSIAMAKVFIENLKASGGTNMASALDAALTGKRTVFTNQKQGINQVIFITDASVSNEQQMLTQITSQLKDNRLFMVGIGSAPNHYFMKASAKLGKGTYTSIGDPKEVNRKMSALFTKLSTPVLRDLTLSWADGGVPDYWPNPIKDLYQGEPLQIFFKIPQGKSNLAVSGIKYINQHPQPWSQVISINSDNNAQGIATQWAKAQIESIDLSRALSADEKQQKITKLGIDFNIVTQHTSLIAVHPEVVRKEQHNSIDTRVKTHLPFGSTMRLPQTGLASDLYKKYGFLILILAGLLWVINLSWTELRSKKGAVL